MTQSACKIAPRRKNNGQTKLENYFPVLKAKRTKTEINFQGFPITDCCYEKEVDEFVYRPPLRPWSCGNECIPNGSKEHKLCHNCCLRPCIAKVKRNDLMAHCEHVMVFENDDVEAMQSKMFDHADSLLADVFGAPHVRNFPVPACLHELVDRHLCQMTGTTHQEGCDPDHDLVVGAVDGNDFR